MASQIVEMELEMVQMTRPPSDRSGLTILLNDIPLWSRRLMEERIRVAENQAERLAALRDYRKTMLQLEHHLGAYGEVGGGSARTS